MSTSAARPRVADIIIFGLSSLVPLLSVLWITSTPQRLGVLVYPEQVAALMLGFAMTVVFLRGLQDKPAIVATLDGILAVLSAALGVYVFVRFPSLTEAAHLHETETMALGIVVTLLALETLRRVVGWTLVVIFLILFLYALYGDHVPGALVGRPIPIDDVFRFLGADSTATWGQALQIAAFVVVVFVLFGGALFAVGGGDFFTQLAMRVAGDGPGNTAKVAVTASALFGSVSGSAVSNVMSTGVMTIPLMKRSGFTPAQAGAIEAVASTGGQLMPPIMGAAAFLMAEILQIPYREILLAALLPAILYYFSVYLQIDFMARRDKLASIADFDRSSLGMVLRRGWIAVIAFAVLLGCIFYLQIRAELAAVYTIGVTLLLGMVSWALALPYGRLTPRDAALAIAKSGGATCDILIITACAGMIIGLLSTTGLGFALSYYLLDVGDASLFALLTITAAVAIVLGLGLPTTGVYLLLASLAAPALTQLGIEPLTAHMFVLYYGMLSMITPPIALAAFAAASIAGAPQLKTGLQAFRFGWAAYFLPFLFVYKPGLLMNGAPLEIVYVFLSSLVAITLVSGGLLGHALRPLALPVRGAWIIVGLLEIAPLAAFGGLALDLSVTAFGVFLIALHAFALRLAAGRAARAGLASDKPSP